MNAYKMMILSIFGDFAIPMELRAHLLAYPCLLFLVHSYFINEAVGNYVWMFQQN